MNLITWPQAKIDWLVEQGFFKTALSRFYQKVEFSQGCWLWKGHTYPNGYGQFSSGDSKKIGAHIFSWLIHFGTIYKGLCVCHNCPEGDNKLCVNPKHLWLGSLGDNCRDRTAKGRTAKGQDHGHSKLTEANVLQIRELYKLGYMQKQIAGQFGISQTAVSKLVLKKRWQHI